MFRLTKQYVQTGAAIVSGMVAVLLAFVRLEELPLEPRLLLVTVTCLLAGGLFATFCGEAIPLKTVASWIPRSIRPRPLVMRAVVALLIGAAQTFILIYLLDLATQYHSVVYTYTRGGPEQEQVVDVASGGSSTSFKLTLVVRGERTTIDYDYLIPQSLNASGPGVRFSMPESYQTWASFFVTDFARPQHFRIVYRLVDYATVKAYLFPMISELKPAHRSLLSESDLARWRTYFRYLGGSQWVVAALFCFVRSRRQRR